MKESRTKNKKEEGSVGVDNKTTAIHLYLFYSERNSKGKTIQTKKRES